MRASSTDRYTNRLTEFATDVKADEREQFFFAATKGGQEKIERLLKEFELSGRLTITTFIFGTSAIVRIGYERQSRLVTALSSNISSSTMAWLMPMMAPAST